MTGQEFDDGGPAAREEIVGSHPMMTARMGPATGQTPKETRQKERSGDGAGSEPVSLVLPDDFKDLIRVSGTAQLVPHFFPSEKPGQAG